MQSKSTIQMRRLAWGAVAFWAILVLSAAPGHALTVSVSDDTFTNAKKPNQNNGTKENVSVRTGRGERDTFVRFDLSTIPAGVTGSLNPCRYFFDVLNGADRSAAIFLYNQI